MAKIVYRDKRKSVFLSHAEALLLLVAEFGAEILDAFFPAKYPETWLTRRLLGLDEWPRTSVRVAKHRLIRLGFMAKHADGSYEITPHGNSTLRKLQVMIRFRDKPVWDGKWRIVVFDVPEKYKKHREALRRELAEAGYQRLQDSVWIGKHPLPEEMIEFIEACNIDRYIHIFLSDTADKAEQVHALFKSRAR